MKAAIYARISQDANADHLGVDRQLTDCRAAARQHGWEVVHEYVDNDVSATRRKSRPQYTRMLASIEARAIDALIVWDVDRLTRTPRELEDIIDLANAYGLELLSIGGDIDLATPQGKLTARVKGSVARHETDQQSRRIKRKIQEKAEKGEPHGMVPYGFQRTYQQDESGSRRHGRDIPKPAEADIIREITRRILAGQSLRSTVQLLNERGNPSPRGGRWSSATLRQVLLRGTNAGLRTHRGEVVGKSTTEPILSEDDYYRLVSVLKDPTRRAQLGTTPRHLLTGIAECGLCGGKMRRLKGVERAGKKGPEAYGCRDCFKIRRSMALVDAYVEGVVIALLTRPDALAALAVGNPDRAREAQTRAEAINARLLNAADQFAEGVISAEQMARISAKLRPQLDEARESLACFAPVTSVAQMAGPDAASRWAAASLPMKRELIDALMTVTILPAGPGRGADPRLIRAVPKTV
ncbi:recombinase family protein [Kocuria sabuli]|uniref:recombinase family protein n=1 Tax=Kocuria sabuli TaxID=3071448 RepID=UPI0034D5BDBB